MVLTSGVRIRGRTGPLIPSAFFNALRTRFSPRLRAAYGILNFFSKIWSLLYVKANFKSLMRIFGSNFTINELELQNAINRRGIAFRSL